MDDCELARRSQSGLELTVDEGLNKIRGPYLRDRDKIYYSDEFRRLEGITQVAEIEVPGLHNRLTHSLRVEQIARTLACKLSEKYENKYDINVDVVKAAALAHDLGHPPFGHAGETALQEVITCKSHLRKPEPWTGQWKGAGRSNHGCDFNGSATCLQDSFEGNAQTVRILSVIGIGKNYDVSRPVGLDLRKRTLKASAKYPWLRGEGKAGKKWCFYDCDAKLLEWSFGDVSDSADEGLRNKTLESQIMDWADDIAYAVHDIEDFFRAGIIPLHQLGRIAGSFSFKEFSKYLENSRDIVGDSIASMNGQWADFSAQVDSANAATTQEERAKILTSTEQKYPLLSRIQKQADYFPKKRFTGSAQEIRNIGLLRNTLIRYFEDAVIINQAGNLDFDSEGGYIRDVNSVMKQLVWFYVIDSPVLAAVQAGQKDLIGRLYRHYYQALLNAWRPDDDEGFQSDGKEARLLPRRLVDFAMITDQTAERWKGSYGGDGLSALNRARAVTDFVASLSETQAYSLGARLMGSTAGRTFEVGVV